eukprot:CAMPEP_0196801486 /NCGR_PEP_ID=MMETSP1362-20130617/1253_1 /TAXON_ID=163516 /ORGANISM="Leptocylindrus danicus, Strain CCMP1856" /LENGTH=323 /DNA_ID=CAMNT_0042172485 /DNA_START=101 /DNA_END=1072 /DNA_ORIENTATION=-
MRIFQAAILAISQVHSFQPRRTIHLRGGGAAHTRDLPGYSSTLKYEEHQQQLDSLVDGAEIGESFEETRENSEVADVEWVQEEDLASDVLDVVEEVPDKSNNVAAMSMTSPRLFHVAQDTPAEFEDEKQSTVSDTTGVGEEGEEEEDVPSFETEPTEPDEEIPPPLTVDEIEKIDVDATMDVNDNTELSTANKDMMTTDEEFMEDTSTVIQEKSISSATDTLAMRAKSIGTSFFETEDETPASLTVTITSPNVGSAVFEYDGKASSSSTTEGVMSEASSVFEFEDEATIEAASDVKFGGFEFEEDEEDMTMTDQDTLEMTDDL